MGRTSDFLGEKKNFNPWLILEFNLKNQKYELPLIVTFRKAEICNATNLTKEYLATLKNLKTFPLSLLSSQFKGCRSVQPTSHGWHAAQDG